MRIQIQLVTWNSSPHLKNFFDSLSCQTRAADIVLAIDNNSTDETKRILSSYDSLETILLTENSGYSHAHNLGLARALVSSDVVICVNPDIILSPTVLEEIELVMNNNPAIASASPLLLRPKDPLTNQSQIDIVDSAGIIHTPWWRFTNADEGSPLTTTHQHKILSANTGACVGFRVSALQALAQKTKCQTEFFDEDFFAYQEDIDLGLRLSRIGYQHVVVEKTTAIHARTLRASVPILSRKPSHVYLSYRNHLLLLVKNFPHPTTRGNIFLILLFEKIKFLILLVTQPKSLFRGLRDVIKLFPRIRKKRALLFTL